MHSQVLYLAQSNSAINLEGQVSSSLENTSRIDTHHNENADNWGGRNSLYVSGPTYKNHICKRDSTVHLLFYNLQWKLQHIKINVNKFHLYVSQQRTALATGNSKLYKKVQTTVTSFIFLLKVPCHNDYQTSMEKKNWAGHLHWTNEEHICSRNSTLPKDILQHHRSC